MGKTCVICGKPSGMYPLCREHLDMKNEGKVVKCPDCGTWYCVKDGCVCSRKKETVVEKEKNIKDDIEQKYCIVCGEPISGKYQQCKNCYSETREYMGSLDKNSSMYELRDYYYNLKDNIYRMKKFDIIQSNCNKLLAIAVSNQVTNNDSSLTSRACKDIIDIITAKKPKADAPVVSPIIEEKDEKRENIYWSVDGHGLKSPQEVNIDNVLWKASILHAYEKQIVEFDSVRKKCDWFIPVTGPNKGIYIEYWGMDTPKYLKDRQEKEQLYKEYNVPYVGIEKDDPKDTRSFESDLIRALRQKSKDFYGFWPEWQK